MNMLNIISQPGDFFRITFHGPGDNILNLVPDIPKERQADLKELGLNKKQVEALRLMINEKKIFIIKKYYKLFQINERTARRDLKMLIEKGFIEKKGTTKKAFFKAK